MERPSVNLWDKDFLQKNKEWVAYHILESGIDNLNEFVKYFMTYSKGKMNPSMIHEVWNEQRGNDV